MFFKLSKTFALRINLLLAVIGGSIALWVLLREPSEAQAAILLGFSLPRLLILAVIILVLLSSVFLFLRSLRDDFWTSRIGGALRDAFMGTWLAAILLVLSLALYFSLFMTDQRLGSLASYRARLYPLLVWLAALVGQLFITLLAVRAYGSGFFRQHREVLSKTLLVFIVLGLLVLFIAISKVGLTPDVVYWQDAGVPLLLEQVLFAWGIGVGFYVLFDKLESSTQKTTFSLLKRVNSNLILAIAIWGLASAVWLLQPQRYSYNSLEPKAPNFQSYPFGDSIYYDIHAQYFLVGIPLPSHFWVKPLYTFFLSLLHVLAGQDYVTIVTLQVLVLALIPALVYLLVSAIGNRPAALVAALLVILRERNAIALSNVIQDSNSRLLMSDVFSMGVVVLLAWLMITWLKRPVGQRVMPLAAGGALGLLVLTRGHPILLLPFVIFAAILVYLPKRSSPFWRADLILLCVGFLMPLAPWFWRNYQQTGKLTLQDPPVTYMGQTANLYSEDPNVGHGLLLPGESIADFQARIQKQMFDYVVQHPDDVIRFVSAHYFHNLIFSYTYLPQSFQVQGLRSYVKNLPFWEGWQGELPYESQGLLILNLVILSLGFVAIWKKGRMLAFAPLILALGYNLSVSVSRLSGWRFIIPFDWIVLVYYSMGLVQAAAMVYSILVSRIGKFERNDIGDEMVRPSREWKPIGALVMAFLLIGFGVTKGHTLFPVRYPEKAPEDLFRTYVQGNDKFPTELPESNLEAFLAQEDAVIAYGRALYPSYLSPGEGAWNIFWPVFDQKPYDRIAFHLIGPGDFGVLLPIEPASDPASIKFPDGVNVAVIGCRVRTDYVDYIDALAVVVQTEPASIYMRSSIPEHLTCPLPQPEIYAKVDYGQ
jgi:4-amino-4-deoxy-L-arabinose transferase-like glycosyltransferase